MTISTYAQLKTAVETWRARATTEITTNAADFVTLAEAKLTRELPLRMMWTNTTLTATAGSRELDLPATFVEDEWLKITTDDRFDEIRKRTADRMRYISSEGEPTEWCINGENIDLNRPAASAYTFSFRYRAKFALSDAAPTNWLLTHHPDIYLAAVLVWSGLLIKADDIGQWNALLMDGMAKLKTTDARAEGDVLTEIDPGLLPARRYVGYPYNLEA
jgi:hypothetical protein